MCCSQKLLALRQNNGVQNIRMPPSLFQKATNLNNEAINALIEGDCDSAINSMANAIQLMKTQLSSYETPQSSSSSSEDLHCDHDADDAPSCSSSSSQEDIDSCCTVEIPVMDSSDTTIMFNQAVRLPANDGDAASSLPNEFEMNIYISAVVFNLALAHQFKASTKNNGSGEEALCLLKAETLYSLVLKLLKDCSYLNVHIALIVKLASINNLSQIQYSKGEYGKVREGLSQISIFLQTCSSPNAQALLEEPQVQGLLMNVLFLKTPTVARAA